MVGRHFMCLTALCLLQITLFGFFYIPFGVCVHVYMYVYVYLHTHTHNIYMIYYTHISTHAYMFLLETYLGVELLVAKERLHLALEVFKVAPVYHSSGNVC